MKNLIFIFIASALFTSCTAEKKPVALAMTSSGVVEIQKLSTDISGLSMSSATLKTVHGDITFRFYTKIAPRTSSRIIELIQNKFYDGLIFHRAIPNFIVQTGDNSNSGRVAEKFAPEFNELQHIKGTIGLARGIAKDSGDTQFYISLTTLPHLDGKYTVFGQVVEGLDILPKLARGDRILSATVDIKN